MSVDVWSGGPTAMARARNRGELAAVVAARRHELDLSQGELADLADVARGTVVSVEAGRSVSLDVLLSLLQVLGLHLEVVRGAAAAVEVSDELTQQYGMTARNLDDGGGGDD